MVWFTKKPAHRENNPPIAATQEHNNQTDLDKVAQGDRIPAANTTETLHKAEPAKPSPEQPERHKMHSFRAEAMQFLGLPDIAPPPGDAIIVNKAGKAGRPPAVPPLPKATQTPNDKLQKSLDEVAHDLAVSKARVNADIDLDNYTSTLNQNSEINAALAPQKRHDGKCADHSDDELIDLLSRGYLQIEVARLWNVPPVTLFDWIKASPERFARALKAKEAAGQACDAKAMEVLRTCTPETAYKARAIAAYLQWRASKLSPDYQDKQRLTVDGGLTIQHETPDRPAITDLIGQALAAVTPAPRMIDVEPSPD
jgi:hypothetical protein